MHRFWKTFTLGWWVLVLALTPISSTAGELFSDLSFDEALAEAQRADKLILIDYYTTWCVPCKKMDATTWVDPEVLDWVAEHAIALHLDAEVETDLAQRHAIKSFPTTLLLDSHGAEVDRLTGYKSAEELLSEIRDGLAGKTALIRAREAWEAAPDDLIVRKQYAKVLADKGKHAEALEHYLACWDAPGAENSSFAGVRVSFLLSEMAHLAKHYEPAREALEARRKAVEVALLQGEAENDGTERFSLVASYEGLARHLDPEHTRTLELYDRLVTQGESRAETRRHLARQLAPVLVEKRRYQDLLDDQDPFDAYSRALQSSMGHLDRLTDTIDESMREHAIASIRSQVTRSGLLGVEALLGTGESERAFLLVDQLLDFDSSPDTWRKLLAGAERADNTAALERLEARAPSDLDDPPSAGADD